MVGYHGDIGIRFTRIYRDTEIQGYRVYRDTGLHEFRNRERQDEKDTGIQNIENTVLLDTVQGYWFKLHGYKLYGDSISGYIDS